MDKEWSAFGVAFKSPRSDYRQRLHKHLHIILICWKKPKPVTTRDIALSHKGNQLQKIELVTRYYLRV